MLRLTPPDRIGEFYGLYGMVGRFSAITGPGLWALTTYLLVELSGLPVLVGEGAAILVLLGDDRRELPDPAAGHRRAAELGAASSAAMTSGSMSSGVSRDP